MNKKAMTIAFLALLVLTSQSAVAGDRFTNSRQYIGLAEQRLLANEVMMRAQQPYATRTDRNRAVILQMLQGVMNRTAAGSIEHQYAAEGIHNLLRDYARERRGM